MKFTLKDHILTGLGWFMLAVFFWCAMALTGG